MSENVKQGSIDTQAPSETKSKRKPLRLHRETVQVLFVRTKIHAGRIPTSEFSC